MYKVSIAVLAALALAAGCQPAEPPGGAAAPLHVGPPRADRRDPPPAAQQRHPRLEFRLLRLASLVRDKGPGAAAAWARARGIDLRAGQVLVEITPAQGLTQEHITDATLARFGARAVVRGFSLLDARVPLSRLLALADDLTLASQLRAPPRQQPEVGGVTTQGVALSGAGLVHCPKITGQGVKVAVLDIGFAKWSASEAAGELPKVGLAPLPSSDTHGTSCAEVLADMAPGVTIYPVLVPTRSSTEGYVKDDLPGSGVTIMTRSLSSIGGGFDDGKGFWCELAKKVKAQGAVWVNSAGNNGGGKSYRARFADLDQDGWHEFSPGDEYNRFSVSSTKRVRIQLDWSDYPRSSEDFDLYLYRLESSKWVQVASSKNVQSGTQEPYEFITVSSAPKGSYAARVYRRGGQKLDLTMRMQLISGGGNWAHYKSAGSLNTSAACADVISVAALPEYRYHTGPQSSSSSQGPTHDRRIKPDIAAPTIVNTLAKKGFGGTSAAAPHVAGAIALYRQATGQDIFSAAKLVLQDAQPMGSPDPSPVYGHGRLSLLPSRAGWQCKAGQLRACLSKCGTSGRTVCGAGCGWGACVAPAESCNGKDDDCDGKPDNGFACALGQLRGCSTSCASQGSQTCARGCTWGACKAPVESCNGKDDDCDGQVDEGLSCPAADDAGCMVAGHADVAGPLLGLLLLMGLLFQRSRRWF